MMVALISEGHLLFEGPPGTGKTLLARAFSACVKLDFKRVQFTPDLMPADIIGTNIMTAGPDGAYRFEFRRGPIFTQLLLADEINRATPKTQSALLESMQEGSVTTGGVTHQLKPPFFVLATQNPIEQEGTYPLPEAQLDRFMFKINVASLSRAELNEMVTRTIIRQSATVAKIVDASRILQLRQVLDKVVVADPIRDYAVRLVLATHPDSEFATERIKRYLKLGASPRGCQALIRGGRVRALAAGRAHVSTEDLRTFAPEVLGHRLLLSYDGQADNIRVLDLVKELVEQVPVEA
jgi:MoxR-like ATPase